MDPEPDHITFHAEGSPRLRGQVPAKTVLEMLRSFLLALDLNARDASREMSRTVEWVVTDVRRGSFEFEVAPAPADVGLLLVASQAMQTVIRQSNAVASGRAPERIGSVRAARQVKRMADLASADGVPLVQLTRGDLSATIVPRGASRAPLLALDRSLGSIEGTVMGVTFAGSKPQFTLRNRLDGGLVECYFGEEHEDEVIAALKQRVLVSGLVTTRADGTVPSVAEVDGIYVFPPDRSLPTIADLVGIDPDLAEGLPAEVWVRRNRDRD